MKFSRRVAIVLNSFIDFAPPRGPPLPLPSLTRPSKCIRIIRSRRSIATGVHLLIYTRHMCVFVLRQTSPLPPPRLVSRATFRPLSPSLAPRSFPPPPRAPSKPHLPTRPRLSCLHTCDKEREAEVLEKGRRERDGQGRGRGGEVSRQRLLRWKKRVHHFAK